MMSDVEIRIGIGIGIAIGISISIPIWAFATPSRGEKYRMLVPEYIKDYVSLNQFAA